MPGGQIFNNFPTAFPLHQKKDIKDLKNSVLRQSLGSYPAGF